MRLSALSLGLVVILGSCDINQPNEENGAVDYSPAGKSETTGNFPNRQLRGNFRGTQKRSIWR